MTNAIEQLSRQNLIERRIGRQEFAPMLNIEPETLDSRIRDGRYNKSSRLISGFFQAFTY